MSANSIRTEVTRLCDLYAIPGLAYTVVCNGIVETTGCVGLASIPFDVPVTNRTLFHTGSVGKHMTGVALLRLTAAKLVDLEAPIVDYVEHVPQHWSNRTIRCLMHHTSGLPNYTDHIIDDRKMSNEDLYKAIAAEPLRFIPGQYFDYSNTNYRLIGDVIEAVCQQSYAEHMDKEIFELAGLEDTIIDSCDLLVNNHAEPYMLTKRGLERATSFFTIELGSADGGIAMSARDVAKWDSALWNGTLLDADSLQLMVEPVTLNSGRQYPYALGWHLESVGDSQRVWHGGTMPGFKAHYLHSLKDDLSVFVMSNMPQSIAAEKHIAEVISEHVRPGTSPMSLSPLDDDDTEATELAYSIVFRTSKSLPFKSLIEDLHSPLSNAASVVNLLDLSANGVPDSFELVEQREANDGNLRRYRACWGSRFEHISVSRQENGLIDRVGRC